MRRDDTRDALLVLPQAHPCYRSKSCYHRAESCAGRSVSPIDATTMNNAKTFCQVNGSSSKITADDTPTTGATSVEIAATVADNLPTIIVQQV
jgi:hypothetical protein